MLALGALIAARDGADAGAFGLALYAAERAAVGRAHLGRRTFVGLILLAILAAASGLATALPFLLMST